MALVLAKYFPLQVRTPFLPCDKCSSLPHHQITKDVQMCNVFRTRRLLGSIDLLLLTKGALCCRGYAHKSWASGRHFWRCQRITRCQMA